MNNLKDFTNTGNSLIEWLAEYFNFIEKRRVVPGLQPGEIENKLPESAPDEHEEFEVILNDFKEIIMPGITHWQHPGFHAYFPANNSYPSVLAEILTAGLGVQGMKWITSPAATELEKVVVKWLQQLIGIKTSYRGVIMDTASVATLCAILAARERKTNFAINEKGFQGETFRVYCSSEAHSSIDKAVRIAGIGSNNLIKIPVNKNLELISSDLREAIDSDIKKGFTPLCVVGALGTTGTCAIDPLNEIADITKEYDLWYHIDAAYAGSALILPEFQQQVQQYNLADSFVFNPHKWLFTNFDCSVFYVKNSSDLTKTFSLVPEYLQTGQDDDLDFSNYGIQLGRRFRSLKLWFVIRSFGVSGLQQKIRAHIKLGELFENNILNSPGFELVVPRSLNVICFRYVSVDNEKVNDFNKLLLEKINQTNEIFLSHTIINGNFVIRFVCGQTNVKKKHIEKAWKIISSTAKSLASS
jgi:aromatic-L-amino-acid decarboxylase